MKDFIFTIIFIFVFWLAAYSHDADIYNSCKAKGIADKAFLAWYD